MNRDKFLTLSGAVAVVTGGGRGIGRAIVNRLSEMEATVVLTGRDEALLHQVANDLAEPGTSSGRSAM